MASPTTRDGPALAIAIRDRSSQVRAPTLGPRFRVGVNTGVAVIGNVGAGYHRSFSVIGDTTNVAARLQGLSTPGHITIAGRTVAEVNTETDVVIDVRPMGLADLKGKASPTEAFELLSVTSAGERRRSTAARPLDYAQPNG